MSPWTLINWESSRTSPPIKLLPAIVAFLGYDPFPLADTLPERLLAQRRTMGWSIREAAERAGVDPATWAAWERSGVVYLRHHRRRLTSLLGVPLKQVDLALVTQRKKS